MPPSLSPHRAPPVHGAAAGLDSRGLSSTSWVDLAPWLRGYRTGPPILSEHELVPNAWLTSSPAETVSDSNAREFFRLVAERFVADLAHQRLGEAFPHVRATVPITELSLSARSLDVLTAAQLSTTRDVLACTVDVILTAKGAGPATAGDIVLALVTATAYSSPRSVVTDGGRPNSAVNCVEAVVDACSSREQIVVLDRIFTRRPITLDELASRLGVSRRQAERLDEDVRRRVIAELRDSAVLGQLSERIHGFATPFASLARIERSVPELAEFVPVLRIPLWDVISHIDTGFSIDTEWVTAPTAAHARDTLSTVVGIHATSEALSSVYAVANDLSVPAPELIAYAQSLGYRVHDGHLLPRGLSIPDLLAAILTLAGRPTSMVDLIESISPRRSESAVRNALVTDPRFVKSDRTLWALTTWSIEPYVPIHRQIANIVDDRGSIGFDRLVSEITRTYDVKEHSIRTYASSGEFVIEGEVVRRRRRKYTPRKSPSKTRYLYRDGDVVRWRTTIGPIHRKGSAFNLPSALAALLDVGPGSPQEFASRLGSQSVIWVSVQARSGTIKRFVHDMQLEDGEDVFLEFGSGTFELVRVSTATEDSHRAAMTSIGRRGAPSTALAAVADALWLDSSASRQQILDTLRARREPDLAALVADL